jgi:hypothetical protein
MITHLATSHVALTMLASSSESKKSGPIGLAVILLLCVACYFLFKSMSKHLRKVRDDFPQPDTPVATQPAATQPSAATDTSAPDPDEPADARPQQVSLGKTQPPPEPEA